jgi:hypothetical protein
MLGFISGIICLLDLTQVSQCLEDTLAPWAAHPGQHGCTEKSPYHYRRNAVPQSAEAPALLHVLCLPLKVEVPELTLASHKLQSRGWMICEQAASQESIKTPPV